MKTIDLSVVLVGRNDNYGGDFKSRLQSCITWTFNNLTNQEIKSEIIFVNYNPLSDNSILDFLNWPKSNEFVSIRIITIPTSIHEQILKRHEIKNVPVLEYFAKNAGIRRANGKFILSMNPDILIDERIFFKFRNLQTNYFYRANRCDFNSDFIQNNGAELRNKSALEIKTIWFKGRKRSVKNYSKLNYAFLWFFQTLENIWKRNSFKFSFALNYLKLNYYSHNVEFKYHCNAAGDFMLLSKENWLKLKGYKEKVTISLHTDAIFVIQAATLGLKEKIFFYPIYHKDHDRRFNAEIENELQRLHYLTMQKECQQMINNWKPQIYNSNDWGLVNFELKEIQL